jgi:hypothetical protein
MRSVIIFRLACHNASGRGRSPAWPTNIGANVRMDDLLKMLAVTASLLIRGVRPRLDVRLILPT